MPSIDFEAMNEGILDKFKKKELYSLKSLKMEVIKEAKTIAERLNTDNSFKKKFRADLDKQCNDYIKESDDEKDAKSELKDILGKYASSTDVPKLSPSIYKHLNNRGMIYIDIWSNDTDQDFNSFVLFATDKLLEELKKCEFMKYPFITRISRGDGDEGLIYIEYKTKMINIDESGNLLDW